MRLSLGPQPAWIQGGGLLMAQTVRGRVHPPGDAFDQLAAGHADHLVSDMAGFDGVLVRGEGFAEVTLGNGHLVVLVACADPAELTRRWPRLGCILQQQALRLEDGPILWSRHPDRDGLLARARISVPGQSPRPLRAPFGRRPSCD